MNSREYARDARDSSKIQLSYHGALTVDLEDWKNALNPKPNMKHAEIDVSYMRESTKRILHILEEYETKATFFVLGEVALALPEIVKEISRRGHEIGSHSPSHVPPRDIPRDTYKSLVKRDHELLEQITGQNIRGFRAPYFAIRRNEGWLLHLLSDCGFLYDSSIVPSWNPLYGIPGAPKSSYFPDLNDVSLPKSDGRILEIPVTVWPQWKSLPGLPIGGGFFVRVWPQKLHSIVLNMVLRNDVPLNLYVHPGDLDSRKEFPEDIGAVDKAIQSLGLRRGLSNFRALLKEFRLGRVSDIYATRLEEIAAKKG